MGNRFHSRIAPFILVVVLLTPAASVAGDKVIFSFFSRGWPPFEMVVDGLPQGAAIDLFHALMPADVEPVVELVPAPRNKLRATDGPIHVRLESREWIADPENFFWSDPVVDVATVLYSPKEKPLEYTGDSSLFGLTIGCIKGFVYPAVQHLFVSGKAVRYDVNDDLILLRMIKAGRVDAALFDDISVRWILKGNDQMECSDFYVSRNEVSSESLRFYFNRIGHWEQRIPEINALIKEKRANGTIREIMSRYRK